MMNIDLQNENVDQVKKMAKEITRSNIIINSLYDFVEDYLNLKNKDLNLLANKEVINELEKIVFLVKEINDERIKVKENRANLVINFKVKHGESKDDTNQNLPTNLSKLEKIMAMSTYYKPVIEKWIFSLCLIANKKMTNEIYDYIYNYHMSKKQTKIKNEWKLENFDENNLRKNWTVQFPKNIKKPKSSIEVNEYLKNLFNKPYEGLQTF